MDPNLKAILAVAAASLAQALGQEYVRSDDVSKTQVGLTCEAVAKPWKMAWDACRADLLQCREEE